MPDIGIRIIIIIVVILLTALIMRISYDSNRFVKEEYTIYSKKIRKDCKFVLLSDLHNKSYGKDNYKLIKAIEKINPDAILIAGDMLTANGKKTKYAVPVELIRYLAKTHPVYYGNGNHEYRMKVYGEDYGYMYQSYAEELEKCGVHMLANERIYLPETNIEICGAEIERYYYKRVYQRPMAENYMESLLGRSREDYFELLIAHNPDYFKEYAAWGADLTVSGHVHGGVMRLPFLGGVISPMMHLFPKYDGGLFEEYGKKMILSRGLGMHTIPVRIFNPGELVVISYCSQ